ncbi:TPR end-of-group domain-containing protein [Pelagicoccus mobilis]|uniref:Tetratricopeptide repeat protein n=1 Tax=Pelagicoccus mobilis TaxID=415221 RepID=A0A934RYU4_9BACT|nr:hypothetical protein [Pelagicoccus mobilis]MBK1876837.1 hypothetical protein [Pelagicoccus mobilis]
MIPTSTRLSYANGYLDLGMISSATEELDAIQESERLNNDVLAMRARLYLESQNWEVMEAVSKQLVSQAPELPFGWVNWAYALREMDRNGEAKEVALQGLEKHPKEATLWFNLACYCSLLNEVEEASSHLDKAIELDETFEQSAAQDPDLANLMHWKKAAES